MKNSSVEALRFRARLRDIEHWKSLVTDQWVAMKRDEFGMMRSFFKSTEAQVLTDALSKFTDCRNTQAKGSYTRS